MAYKDKFENFGLGLGLRKDLHKNILNDIENNNADFKWLEIVPENYIDIGGRKRLDFEAMLEKDIQLIPHGVNLSIGTVSKSGEASYDPYLISQLKELFQETKAPWFSDHLSCTRINNYYVQELIPLPFTENMANIVAKNIKFLEDEFQLSFLFENPSYYTKFDINEYSEQEFINKILEKADCGLLLDINNIFVNQENHKDYQAQDFINEIDLDRIVQVHIAGHLKDFHSWLSPEKLAILDTHGEAIIEEVYDLLRYLISKTEIKAVLLERDSNFPSFDELKKELKTIKGILDGKS